MSDIPSIIGWAHTEFGKLVEPDVEALIARVATAAITHAGLGAADIDAIHVGVFNSGFSPQSFDAALVGAGTRELSAVAAVRSENACATGSAALYAALDFIESGRGRIALVVGAEKMTATPGVRVGEILLGATHLASESSYGSFPEVFAALALQYGERHGDPREALAMIAAKNHRNGVSNPYAHMQKDLGFDFCATVSERNPYVAAPLLRTDCSMVSDGAAAMIVASSDVARTAPQAVTVRSRSQASQAMAIANRRDPLVFEGARTAFATALRDADVTLDDLDLLETHDCFTVAELLQYEAFGLAEPGKGAAVLAEGLTERDGRLPVNVSGGLKSKGHPIGATGVSQHVMAAMQLTGQAGAMQLQTADLAAVFNMGGAAVANYATILEAAR